MRRIVAFAGIYLLSIIVCMNVYAQELKKTDLQLGMGKIALKDKMVEVHYTGWLMNGQKFDSSLDRNRPFRFTVGAHQVIPGWEEGVVGMRVGGKRELIIPPQMAYGSRGVGDVIPADSTLRFEIELLSVQEAPLRHIEPSQLQALLDKGVKIVDIRTPGEWRESGVINGAHLLPFRMADGKINQDFVRDLTEIAKKDEEVILICRSGNRSRAAGEFLTQRIGYGKVYNVRKGMKGWLAQQSPVVQPQEGQMGRYQ